MHPTRPPSPAERGRPSAWTLAPGPSTAAAMATDFTHALRTPLGALSSALEVACLPEVTDAVRADACEIALRQQHHLAKLVEDFETYWRLAEGKPPPPGAQTVDFSALVVQAAGDCAPWRGAARVAITPGLHVRGHAASLRQAVEAALQHASGAAVSLTLERSGQPAQAQLRLTCDARYTVARPSGAAPARHLFNLRMAGEVARMHRGTLDEHHWGNSSGLLLCLPLADGTSGGPTAAGA